MKSMVVGQEETDYMLYFLYTAHISCENIADVGHGFIAFFSTFISRFPPRIPREIGCYFPFPAGNFKCGKFAISTHDWVGCQSLFYVRFLLSTKLRSKFGSKRILFFLFLRYRWRTLQQTTWVWMSNVSVGVKWTLNYSVQSVLTSWSPHCKHPVDTSSARPALRDGWKRNIRHVLLIVRSWLSRISKSLSLQSKTFWENLILLATILMMDARSSRGWMN